MTASPCFPHHRHMCRRAAAKETAPDETELLAHGRKFTVPMEATADA
jgi:hypothetical protein